MQKISFGEGNVIIGLSKITDGDMRTVAKTGPALQTVHENQKRFLATIGLDIDDTALVKVSYGSNNFCRYAIADKTWRGAGMTEKSVPATDAIATQVHGLGLFLPLADCQGAVIFDSNAQVLCVAHLGRHSTEQFGAKYIIEFLQKSFLTNPADLLIWLSPSAGAKNYPLHKLASRSLRSVSTEQFIAAGVSPRNITGEEIDTTTSEDYFSYSEALKSGKQLDQRFAIVAKMI